MKTLHLTVAVCGLLLASLVGHPVWANVFNMPSGQKSLEFVTVGDRGAYGGQCGQHGTPYGRRRLRGGQLHVSDGQV